MSKIIIQGGKTLIGNIKISGAKNSALPIMAACLLASENVTLNNVPQLADIDTMKKLLENHGAAVTSMNNSIYINPKLVNHFLAPYDIVSKMRASFLVLGSLLAKYRKAVISLPGGCKIGTRPVDMHLDALVKMGAEISLDQGYVNASVQRRLHGATINFEKNSVGATQNLLIAAALAKGTTVIKNAAQEPEITDLANFICMLGGEIYGAGTSEIIIEGKEELEGGTYEVMPDRIEAATYAIAAIVTKGNLILTNCYNDSLNNFEEFLERSNIEVVRDDHSNIMHINATNAEIRSGHFVTNPFPELATDLQAQVIAMLALGDGISTVTENIFENRFNHVFELKRMNANIEVDHNIATIHGKKILQGAEVMATDLRASASLVIAGLAAEGQTTVNKIHHLDRGYENLEKKLTACGADIQRISSDLLENQISCSM